MSVQLLVEEVFVAPRLLADGTKEDIIAHFQNACKAYDTIIAAKDTEIKSLKTINSALKSDIDHLNKIKGVHIPEKIKYENEELKRKLKYIKDEILDFGNSLEDM